MSDEALKKAAERLPPEIKKRADALMDLDKGMISDIVQCSFLAGMQLAMRICKNRAKDWEMLGGTMSPDQEDLMCAQLIRIMQVEIGAGRMARPEFTKEELEEMDRIK